MCDHRCRVPGVGACSEIEASSKVRGTEQLRPDLQRHPRDDHGASRASVDTTRSSFVQDSAPQPSNLKEILIRLQAQKHPPIPILRS